MWFLLAYHVFKSVCSVKTLFTGINQTFTTIVFIRDIHPKLVYYFPPEMYWVHSHLPHNKVMIKFEGTSMITTMNQ